MAYLLDANIFIQAKNSYYGFSFCPAFWEWLIVQNSAHSVFSVSQVGIEIKRGEDELSEWSSNLGKGFFLVPDVEVIERLSELSLWATKQDFKESAVAEFFKSADYYLIAHALAHNDIVVTHEVGSNSKKRIKIPTVCQELNVQFLNPFEMLRREHAEFVLKH